MSSGCGLTIGPKVETQYIIVHPGKPLRVLDDQKVRGRVLNGDGAPVTQNVGGWVMMPPEHWDAVQRALTREQGAAPATEPRAGQEARDGK